MTQKTNFDPEKFVEGQKNDWNNVAGGWEKWDSWFDARFEPINNAIIDRAEVKTGHKTLDLGSGTGYPALLVAEKVGDTGAVNCLDLSAEMLGVAKKKAEKMGFNHIKFDTCDVQSIPFEDEIFDAITSRFCLMFLPSPGKALAEMHRTLKPGRRFAAAVWDSAEKNKALSLPMKVMMEAMDMKPPNPPPPGIFALSDREKATRLMEEAGFTDVAIEEFPITFDYDSDEHYLDSRKELSAPAKRLLDSLPEEKTEEVDKKIIQLAEEYRVDGKLSFPSMALLLSGRKPGSDS